MPTDGISHPPAGISLTLLSKAFASRSHTHSQVLLTGVISALEMRGWSWEGLSHWVSIIWSVETILDARSPSDSMAGKKGWIKGGRAMAQSGTISGSFREFWAGVFCGLVLRVFQNLVETIERFSQDTGESWAISIFCQREPLLRDPHSWAYCGGPSMKLTSIAAWAWVGWVWQIRGLKPSSCTTHQSLQPGLGLP